MLCCRGFAGGGAGEPVSDSVEAVTEERGGRGNVVRPVAGVRPCVLIEDCGNIAPGPAGAVDSLPNDVDDAPNVLAVVQSVRAFEELGGDKLC